MRVMAVLAGLGLLCAVGCDDDTGAPFSADLAVRADLAFPSRCGLPGDPAINSDGVGKFCMEFSDCVGNGKANFCSSLGDSTTFFCTYQCDPASANACGAGTSCSCQAPGLCACVPKSCVKGDGGAT